MGIDKQRALTGSTLIMPVIAPAMAEAPDSGRDVQYCTVVTVNGTCSNCSNYTISRGAIMTVRYSQAKYIAVS